MRIAAIAFVLTGTVPCLFGGSISVDTSASEPAGYGTYSETAGPLPQSDLDFNPEFDGQFFHSIPLEVTVPCQPIVSCPTYGTPVTSLEILPVNDGIPSDVPANAVVSEGGAIPGGYGNTILSNSAAVSPEPGGFILLGIGLLLLAGGMRRRKSAE
jgi:hypothetical protein